VMRAAHSASIAKSNTRATVIVRSALENSRSEAATELRSEIKLSIRKPPSRAAADDPHNPLGCFGHQLIVVAARLLRRVRSEL
jgi:hypothetical protein